MDGKADVPTPPVDPEDIRLMWEFSIKVRKEYGSSGVNIGLRSVRLDIIGIPEANFRPVWVRAGVLDLLVKTGMLQPWMPGSAYEQRLFEVVAKFPIQVGGSFEGKEFLRQVGEAE